MTEQELREENEKLKGILRTVRLFFSWGTWRNEKDEELADCSPGASIRIVSQPICQAIDAAIPPPWA
jgi:hypothetical protein